MEEAANRRVSKRCWPCDSRGEKRRRALLQVAHELFMQQGYAATSLQQIVHRAGGSMSTAYRFFGNKQQLFRAVMLGVLEDIRQQLFVPEWLHQPPAQVLPRLAAQLIHLSVSPQVLALRRLVIAESHHQPELARELLGYTETGLFQPLSSYFAKYVWRGALQGLSPGLLASLFAQSCFSRHANRILLLDCGDAPTPQELDQLAIAAAELFLTALDDAAAAGAAVQR